MLLGLLLIVPGVLVPGFAKVFIDDVMLQHKTDWLTPLLLLMLGTTFLRFILTWMQETCLLRLHTYLSLALSSKFLLHVLQLPVVFFERRMPGDIAIRVMSNSKVASMLSGQLASAAISLVTIVFYAIVMFMFSVPLAIIGVGVMVVNLFALRMIATGLSEESRRTQQEYGLQYGVLMTGMQVLEPLRSVGRDSDIFDSWYGHQARAVNAQQKLGTLSNVLRSGPSFLQELASSAVILGLGGYLVLKGELSLGTLFAVQILMGSFLAPVGELVSLGQEIQELRADITRLDDVMDAEVDPTVEISLSQVEATAARNRLVGNLEMRDIVFGYDNVGPPLLDGFGLSVRNGGRIAIVGASGSGKTTVARLLAGLWHPWSGEILIDGTPWEKVPREIRAASVAFVDQQISLFKGTVRDNLTLWDTSVPEADLSRALEDACIREELEVSVGGIEGIINEGGDNISGGQRQRLEIARALVQNPSILVLDEATSALDPASELKIDRNLRSRGCTTIIVAHRLSTIRDADEIIVLDHGKVVERGRHEALISQNGAYAELVKQT
jgi:NHLM bacteriocin system ABC transporter peptidase/ATP-binding protein